MIRICDRIYEYLEQGGSGEFCAIAEAVLQLRNAGAELARKLVLQAVEGDERFRVEAGKLALSGKAGAGRRESRKLRMTALSIVSVPTAHGAETAGEVAAVVFDRERILDTRSVLIRPADGLARRAMLEWGVGADELSAALDAGEARAAIAALTEGTVVELSAGRAAQWAGMDAGRRLSLGRLASSALGRRRWTLERICAALGLRWAPALRAGREARLIALAGQDLLRRLDEKTGATLESAEEISDAVENALASGAGDYALDRATIEDAPAEPGVYVFKDQSGCPVYVGKSANLRARVRSYFYSRTGEDAKKQAIRESAASLECERTGSELIALMREAELIERLRPRINLQFEVHGRSHPYVGRRSVAVVLPSARLGFLDVVIVAAGRSVEVCRIGRGGRVSRKLEKAVRKCFQAHGGEKGASDRCTPQTPPSRRRLGVTPGASTAARLAASWIERRRGKVDYVVIDEQADARAALQALARLIAEARDRTT